MNWGASSSSNNAGSNMWNSSSNQNNQSTAGSTSNNPGQSSFSGFGSNPSNPFSNNMGGYNSVQSSFGGMSSQFSQNGQNNNNTGSQQMQQQQSQQNQQGFGYSNNSNNIFSNNPGQNYASPSNIQQNHNFGMMSSPGPGVFQSSQYGNQGSLNMHQNQNHQSGMPGMSAPQGEVPRYRPGYLTGGMHVQSSPGQGSSAFTSYDGRMSPDQQTREVGSSRFGSGRMEPLFTSTSSSTGTGGGRDSPSRSPRNTRFGSSRSLAAITRGRPTSSSIDGDYMDEDAPPTDSLAEFDEETPTYLANGPPQQQQSSSQPNGRGIEGTSPGSAPSFAQHSSSSNQTHKVVVFGFPQQSLQIVLQTFESISPLAYNSSTSSSSPKNSSSNQSANGTNWVTIGYEQEWAALRALRKNGEVIRGNIMIGVKWAEGHHSSSSTNGVLTSSEEVASTSTNGQTQMPRSATSSHLGQPATVLPANKAYLNPLQKPTSSSSALSKAGGGVSQRIADLGKLDPTVFKESNEGDKKEGSGVWGTVSNLIFGF